MHQYLNVIGVPLDHQIDGPKKVHNSEQMLQKMPTSSNLASSKMGSPFLRPTTSEYDLLNREYNQVTQNTKQHEVKQFQMEFSKQLKQQEKVYDNETLKIIHRIQQEKKSSARSVKKEENTRIKEYIKKMKDLQKEKDRVIETVQHAGVEIVLDHYNQTA